MDGQILYTRHTSVMGLFFKHKENVLPGFAITFQSVLQNCEIDYPVDLTGALNKAQGHLNSLLSSPC